MASLIMRRFLTTTAATTSVDSSSFAQSLRDLPKDLPGSNIKKHVSQLIGRTPLVYLNKVTEGCGAYIAVKQEMMQPTASIKDRKVMATDASRLCAEYNTLVDGLRGDLPGKVLEQININICNADDGLTELEEIPHNMQGINEGVDEDDSVIDQFQEDDLSDEDEVGGELQEDDISDELPKDDMDDEEDDGDDNEFDKLI